MHFTAVVAVTFLYRRFPRRKKIAELVGKQIQIILPEYSCFYPRDISFADNFVFADCDSGLIAIARDGRHCGRNREASMDAIWEVAMLVDIIRTKRFAAYTAYYDSAARTGSAAAWLDDVNK